MTLVQEFVRRRLEAPTDPDKKVLFAVLGNLFGRSGFDGEWDGIDQETREEILETNLEIVRANLP